MGQPGWLWRRPQSWTEGSVESLRFLGGLIGSSGASQALGSLSLSTPRVPLTVRLANCKCYVVNTSGFEGHQEPSYRGHYKLPEPRRVEQIPQVPPWHRTCRFYGTSAGSSSWDGLLSLIQRPPSQGSPLPCLQSCLVLLGSDPPPASNLGACNFFGQWDLAEVVMCPGLQRPCKFPLSLGSGDQDEDKLNSQSHIPARVGQAGCLCQRRLVRSAWTRTPALSS